MQIVIKLSDKIYDTIMDDEMPTNEQMKVIVQRIYEGIPLPKGCGDLIDPKPIYDSLIRSYRADKKDYPERGKEYRVGLSNAIDLLNAAPTIIEAESEE